MHAMSSLIINLNTSIGVVTINYNLEEDAVSVTVYIKSIC